MKIAFYSPMKPPDHPVPSGDRTMANLLIRAMRRSGHAPELVSRFRTFSRAPDVDRIWSEAEQEHQRLAGTWKEQPTAAPDLWFTYHTYYKAPDVIGPRQAEALGIPYVTAEASYAGKRDRDQWRQMQGAVIDCIKSAAVNFCFTAVDRDGLERLVSAEQIADLPPFIDTAPYADTPEVGTLSQVCRLVTVAMMRPGVKLQSYAFLAQSLSLLAQYNWTLTIIGDGGERANVEQLFAGIPTDRVRWTGELSADQVRDELRRSDVYLWPGFGEAYGLSYLEAQASGLPVVALETAGVPSVVQHGRTGFLVPHPDPRDYRSAVEKLISDVGLRRTMSLAAYTFVHELRDLDTAAATIDVRLRRVVAIHHGKRLT